MKALDLFCGAGGASEGLHQAGFVVTGIDIQEQPEYPFEFIQQNVMDLELSSWNVDFIWASPPCQAYSRGGNANSRKKYPKLIAGIRKMLIASGKPFVIENVINAPLINPILLCGEMFDLKVIRHRLFETNWPIEQPLHPKHKGTVSDGNYFGVYTGGRPGCFGNNTKRYKLKVGTIQEWQKAMGIQHITDRKMLAESIPPAYAKFIGENFLRRNPAGAGEKK